MRSLLLVLLTTAAVSSPVLAETYTIPPSAIWSRSDLALEPLTDSASGVTYLSGGVGKEEIEKIRAKETEYNTTISLSDTKGYFLSGVTVTVTDKDGQAVFTSTTNGPYLLAQLPAGDYKVTATNGAGSKEKVLKVPAEGRAKELRLVLPYGEPNYKKPQPTFVPPVPATATVEENDNDD